MSDVDVERIEVEILAALRGRSIADVESIIPALCGAMSFYISLLPPRSRDRIVETIGQSLPGIAAEADALAEQRPSIMLH